MQTFLDLSAETLYNAAAQGVRILLILLAAAVGSKLVNKSIPNIRKRIVSVMLKHGDSGSSELEKRAETLGGILRKTISVSIWAVAIAMSLREAGFEIAPILASAGVLGLAVGFGAQSLVRDVISGLFLLLENQIRVNDVAVINGVSGQVEEINLRTTVLRSMDGAVHIFPNGAIQTLANRTRDYSCYVFDMGVAYTEDTDRVMEVMQEVAGQLMREEEFAPQILAPLEVLGVDRFADSAVIIKARIRTTPMQQWAVGRELNRRFKKRFDELGIEIPLPQRTIHIAASPPVETAKKA